MKYLSRTIKIVLFLAGAVLIYMGLDFALSDDTGSQTRISFHDFYEEDEVDTLFLGSSHSVYSINAEKLTEDTGKSVFNLATSGQNCIGGYYVIRDAIAHQNIQHIYYEVSIYKLTEEESHETGTYIISDYLDSLSSRVELLNAAFGSDKLINSYLRLRRNFNPSNFSALSKVGQVIKEKCSADYTDYVADEDYLGRGQWTYDKSLAYEGTISINTNSKTFDKFDVEDVQEEEWDYLVKIIDLCQENDIDLTFYITPYSEYYLKSFEGYDAVTQLVYDLAEERNIDLLDFNCVKNEYLQFSLTDYADMDHLRSEQSGKVADFLELYMQDPDGDYFYDNWREKYAEDDTVDGLSYARYFVTKKGEFKKADSAKGTIRNERIELSALSDQDIPAEARVWKLVQNVETGEWVQAEVVDTVQLDAYTSEIEIPYEEKSKTVYQVQLIDPDTGTVLYDALTKFNMI